MEKNEAGEKRKVIGSRCRERRGYWEGIYLLLVLLHILQCVRDPRLMVLRARILCDRLFARICALLSETHVV